MLLHTPQRRRLGPPLLVGACVAVSWLSVGCASLVHGWSQGIRVESEPTGADVFLGAEKKGAEDEPSMLVRERPLEEHAATVERVLAIMRRTRCDATMALDVEAGHTTEQFAADYIRQKRTLEMEERRLMAPPREDGFTKKPVSRRVASSEY